MDLRLLALTYQLHRQHCGLEGIRSHPTPGVVSAPSRGGARLGAGVQISGGNAVESDSFEDKQTDCEVGVMDLCCIDCDTGRPTKIVVIKKLRID